MTLITYLNLSSDLNVDPWEMRSFSSIILGKIKSNYIDQDPFTNWDTFFGRGGGGGLGVLIYIGLKAFDFDFVKALILAGNISCFI